MFFPFPGSLILNPGFVELFIDRLKSRAIIPLNHVILNAKIMDQIPKQHCLFFRRPVQTKNDFRDIGDVFELSQNVFKYRIGWPDRYIRWPEGAKSGPSFAIWNEVSAAFADVRDPDEEYEMR
jgi:hypothetical protein